MHERPVVPFRHPRVAEVRERAHAGTGPDPVRTMRPPPMSGGVNDQLALSEEERQQLRDFVAAAAEFERRRGAGLDLQSRLLVRAAEHIGVLDNRIANLGREYRAIEKSAEQLAARTWAEGNTAEPGALNPYEAP